VDNSTVLLKWKHVFELKCRRCQRPVWCETGMFQTLQNNWLNFGIMFCMKLSCDSKREIVLETNLIKFVLCPLS